jgi:hypothetical protein
VARRGGPVSGARRAPAVRRPRRRLARRDDPDPRVQRGGGDRNDRAGGACRRLSDARGARARRRLTGRNGRRRARSGGGRPALHDRPRPGEPRQGRPAQHWLRPGTARARGRHRCGYASPPRSDPEVGGTDRPVAAHCRRRGCAARHQPHVAPARAPGDGGGRDHRPDPAHAGADRPRRRGRRGARTVSTRSGGVGRGIRPADGHVC